MSKRIEINGHYFRMRRGVMVQIPDKWVGKITYKQTIRKRNSVSRRTRKNKNKST
jgi:hypothetical protein